MESAAGQLQLAIRSPAQDAIQCTFVAIHEHLVQHESCPMQVDLEGQEANQGRKRSKSDGGSQLSPERKKNPRLSQ